VTTSSKLSGVLTSCSRRRSSVLRLGEGGVLPDDRAAHAEADAHGGEAVADVGALGELAGELGHEAHAGAGERVAEGDRAAVRVDAGVVVGDAEVVEEGEDLHGEGLVQLEQADVLDRQAGRAQRPLGRRDGAHAHDLRLDPGEAVADQAHLLGQAELVGDLLGGDDAGRRAVVEPGGVAGGDVAVRAERRLERREVLEGRAGAGRLVRRREAPALVDRAGRDLDEVGLDAALGVGLRDLLLARHGEGVAALLRDVGVAVVQVLGGRAHDQRRGVDQLLGQEARVGVDALAHRVAPHVLDAARDGDVVRAERDTCGDGGHRGHRAGAHAVDGEPGHRLRQAGQQRRRAAEGQALVADLRGRGDRHLVDALGGQAGVAADELADAPDDEVVGARLDVHALGAGLAERGADAVDEDDLAGGSSHGDSRGEGAGQGQPKGGLLASNKRLSRRGGR
jgi:hypothetical protein